MDTDITAQDLLSAYCNGYFPMAQSADSTLDDMHWYDPPERGIIPIDDFHLPRSLKKFLLKTPHMITINRAFTEVIDACAAKTDGRSDTWINPIIRDWFVELHNLGFGHSVEYRDPDGVLLGGLYGLSIGGAFFGESMFSRASNASKIALVYLVARLKHLGFSVLDSQFVNDHLIQFGCHEITRDRYLERLHIAVQADKHFWKEGEEERSFTPNDIADFLEAR